jgi:hypothetical protein
MNPLSKVKMYLFPIPMLQIPTSGTIPILFLFLLFLNQLPRVLIFTRTKLLYLLTMKSLKERVDSVENLNPEFPASSSSDDSGPALAVKKPKVCSRGKCVEGRQRKNGTIPTFTAKADETYFSNCDQCRLINKTVYAPKLKKKNEERR